METGHQLITMRKWSWSFCAVKFQPCNLKLINSLRMSLLEMNKMLIQISQDLTLKLMMSLTCQLKM